MAAPDDRAARFSDTFCRRKDAPMKAVRVAHEALWEAIGVAAMALVIVLLGSIV